MEPWNDDQERHKFTNSLSLGHEFVRIPTWTPQLLWGDRIESSSAETVKIMAAVRVGRSTQGQGGTMSTASMGLMRTIARTTGRVGAARLGCAAKSVGLAPSPAQALGHMGLSLIHI